MALTFISYFMLIKLAAILVLLPCMVFGITKLFKKLDKDDDRWSLENIKDDPLATSVFAGFYVLSVFIFFGLVMLGSLISIFT